MVWYGMGYGQGAVIRVKNNTEDVIKKVTFLYNDDVEIKIKNIKSSSNKQTGITTMYGAENIRMVVDGCDKVYPIKSHIDERTMTPITIDIKSISSDECIFEMREGEEAD